MTKTEERALFKKISKLLELHNDAVVLSISQKMASRGIDMDKYDLTDYSLPKVLLTSALHDHKDDFTPLYGPWQDDVQNLIHF